MKRILFVVYFLFLTIHAEEKIAGARFKLISIKQLGSCVKSVQVAM